MLIFDEMHIKEDLVFNKTTGLLKGFINVCDINNHLMKFEQLLATKKSLPALANSMLMLMVRGIFTSLRFPYVQFPCKTLSGDTLYPIVWKAIQRLELLGCKVLAIICDGASSNCSFFCIHSTKNSSEAQEQLAYRTRNPFSCDHDCKFLWFVSDGPHLMKTTQNCWASPKRSLWVGYSILYDRYCTSAISVCV